MGDLERRLRELEPPGPEASDRAWRLVAAAFARRAPRRRKPFGRRPVFVALFAAAGTVAALTPAGADVARLVREQPVPVPRPRPAALAHLPGGGSLLVTTADTTFAVGGGRSVRRVAGRSDAVAWSAFGHFVAVARRQTLTVHAVDGRRVWSVAAAAPVRAVAWSPDGTRVAYVAGQTLRVVAGDGSGDRAVGAALPVTPAWRPGSGHLLAYAVGPGRGALIDADTSHELWRQRIPARLRQLAWASDGQRLIALGARRSAVLTGAGRLAHGGRPPRGRENVAVAPAPHGNAFVLLDRAGPTTRATLVRVNARTGAMPRRTLLSAPGLAGAWWSPDARWLLLDWRAKATWLFLSVRGGQAARTVDDVPRHFDRGEPVIAGWCCRP